MTIIQSSRERGSVLVLFLALLLPLLLLGLSLGLDVYRVVTERRRVQEVVDGAALAALRQSQSDEVVANVKRHIRARLEPSIIQAGVDRGILTVRLQKELQLSFASIVLSLVKNVSKPHRLSFEVSTRVAMMKSRYIIGMERVMLSSESSEICSEPDFTHAKAFMISLIGKMKEGQRTRSEFYISPSPVSMDTFSSLVARGFQYDRSFLERLSFLSLDEEMFQCVQGLQKKLSGQYSLEDELPASLLSIRPTSGGASWPLEAFFWGMPERNAKNRDGFYEFLEELTRIVSMQEVGPPIPITVVYVSSQSPDPRYRELRKQKLAQLRSLVDQYKSKLSIFYLSMSPSFDTDSLSEYKGGSLLVSQHSIEDESSWDVLQGTIFQHHEIAYVRQ